MVNKIGARLLEGLLPQICLFCDLQSFRQIPLCSACEADLPENKHCCYQCAIPLPAAVTADARQRCGACLQNPPPFTQTFAPWLYGEHLAHLVRRWKYQGERRLTPLLATLWHTQSPRITTPADLIVPVPLHWRRQWRRGFNQAELLASQLQLNCSALQESRIAAALVRRHRATAAQSGMNAAERRNNLRGVFTVRKRCDNLNIVIVDDVFTTGATATSMSSALLDAGARQVQVLCLARTPNPGT